MFHKFKNTDKLPTIPTRLNNPFCYTPSPITFLAYGELKSHINREFTYSKEFGKGKMLGVMVVRDSANELGFIAAYSGNKIDNDGQDYFVPAIFDFLSPREYFKNEESQISEINTKIKQLESAPTYIDAQFKLTNRIESSNREVEISNQNLKLEKNRRKSLRDTHELSHDELSDLNRESQHQKAEFKRLELSVRIEVEALNIELIRYSTEINALKKERKDRSAKLQDWLFEQFQIRNGLGEKHSILSIFSKAKGIKPPAGAGECAAPRLLNYAIENNLTPISMGEFWWGISPKQEIRTHENFYPACQGKCEPILNYMLQGFDIEPNRHKEKSTKKLDIEICFEDEWMVCIDKPAGVQSVPGTTPRVSILDWARERYPNASGSIIVHRLDMLTSGLLLLAKTREAHKLLQNLFKERVIKKSYVAILDGEISQYEGEVTLPLALDPFDRPRQIVSHVDGKYAHTLYKVIGLRNGCTRISLYPQTGRTHQLRVHSAHKEGLGVAIKGDELYGKSSDRLYLHAERLEFTHPITKESVVIEKKAPF